MPKAITSHSIRVFFPEACYVEATLSYGGNDYDQERRMQYSATLDGVTTQVNQIARSEFFGSQTHTSVACNLTTPSEETVTLTLQSVSTIDP